MSERKQQILQAAIDSLGIEGLLEVVGAEPAEGELQVNKLWPQLWAMGQIEPLVADLVDEIYDKYLQILEQKIEAAGGESPRAEAIGIMSMVEGSILFLSEDKRWHKDAGAVNEILLGYIKAKYGANA